MWLSKCSNLSRYLRQNPKTGTSRGCLGDVNKRSSHLKTLFAKDQGFFQQSDVGTNIATLDICSSAVWRKAPPLRCRVHQWAYKTYVFSPKLVVKSEKWWWIFHGRSVKKSPNKQIQATNNESCCWITHNTLQVLHVFTHVLRQFS